jgi:hypothetical protein
VVSRSSVFVLTRLVQQREKGSEVEDWGRVKEGTAPTEAVACKVTSHEIHVLLMSQVVPSSLPCLFPLFSPLRECGSVECGLPHGDHYLRRRHGMHRYWYCTVEHMGLQDYRSAVKFNLLCSSFIAPSLTAASALQGE